MKSSMKLSTLNIDIINDSSVTDKSEVISSQNEILSDDLNDESFSNDSSVRRLGLFDNISSNNSGETKEEALKSEPIISENIDKREEVETLETLDSTEVSEHEFNATSDELNEEYNQETEEELLDIPTFLRRQAN